VDPPFRNPLFYIYRDFFSFDRFFPDTKTSIHLKNEFACDPWQEKRALTVLLTI
jgi:hypothetical protein